MLLAQVLNPPNEQKPLDSLTSSDADQFNSFLFWREPLASVDDSLLDLLVSSRYSCSRFRNERRETGF